jgi:PHS family inorganic phosphate transporter-like MFS transporter
MPDWIGRVRQQFIGCLIVACLYVIWAGVTNHGSTGGLIALFTLSQFFLNLGPSCSTFLIPVEVFPTRVRATAHGISAASGKAGAVLTSFAFGIASNAIGLPGVLGLFAGALVIAAMITLLIPETKGRTLEEIEAGHIYEKKPSPDVEVSSAGKGVSTATSIIQI